MTRAGSRDSARGRLRLASWACLGLGLVLGTASDVTPERPAVWRGGWRVLQADFHAHSRYSDGFLSPPELVMQAARRGLDVLAVTEHNMLFPAKLARWWSQLTDGPDGDPRRGGDDARRHVHALGIRRLQKAPVPLPEVLAEIDRQGGLAISPRPIRCGASGRRSCRCWRSSTAPS